ncbi:MAG: S9 family peptidase [Acidobacteriota bacterium]
MLAPTSLCRAVAVCVLATAIGAVTATSAAASGLTVRQLLEVRDVQSAIVSSDGAWVAYSLNVQRRAGVDDDGGAWRELHVVSTETGQGRGYVTGHEKVSQLTFTADGSHVLYVAKRGDDEAASLYAIALGGGESRRLLTVDGGVKEYAVSPDGSQVAVLVLRPLSDARAEAKERGYDREVFEEEWRAQDVHVLDMPAIESPPRDPEAAEDEEIEPTVLSVEGSVDTVSWMPDGEHLALTVQPRNLIDDNYMFRQPRVVDATTGATVAIVATPGKLGNVVRPSPDGRHLAFVAGIDENDPSDGRLMIASATDGSFRDAMPSYEAHVTSAVWLDADRLLWVADEGVETVFGTVGLDGQSERLLRSSPNLGVPVVRGELSLALDGRVAFTGESPSHPREAWIWTPGGDRPQRLSASNPWLDQVELARQDVVTWTASDGLELEGLLMHPLDGRKKAPLILMVHGGPEARDRNGWMSNYSRPGQVMAARGYAVFYPNYRGSTGRGVAFSKLGQGDAAGAEFRDLVEAVDHLVEIGVANREQVGITGGSYGGYATAWGSTFYTDRFKAGVMFVGISNKQSKAFTTDIPVEDMKVHTLYEPWTDWQKGLERSPLFYAETSRTPLLIAGGTGDTRVHPSQSLQLYRALKLLDKTVRYVRYPDEPHGNRRAASRHDYTRRILRWMDHFVRDGKTGLPPVELGPEG